MDHASKIISFAKRHLDPADRLTEAMCGLVMVLTFTLTAGLTVASGERAVVKLLAAAIGCNLAWGLIDGALYILTCMTLRSQKARLIAAVQHAPSQDAALELVRKELGRKIGALAPPEETERLCASMLNYLSDARPPRTRIESDDLYGALAIFWVEVVTCLPAAIPFMLISEPVTALRVSNGILITMLFLVGMTWARYVHANRWLAGCGLAAVGLALVGVAVLLGG